MITLLWHHFQAGGWAMWLILFWFSCALGIAFERVLYLFSSQQDTSVFVAAILRCIESRNLALASRVARASKSPLGNIIQAGLEKGLQSPKEIQTALDTRALSELPKLSRRIAYLALFANLSMLCGLFGTIVGLIKSFGALSHESIDAASKARILSDGIAEAMNCTAFGLLAAIVALVLYGWLNSWLQSLEEDIHAVSVQVYNALVDFKA